MIPMTFPDALSRVNQALWPARKVIAVETPRRSLQDDISYVCFEVELKHNGRVREIDLEKRVAELGLQEVGLERACGPGWPVKEYEGAR